LAELEEIRRQCRKMVTKRALTSGAFGALPVPVVDSVVDAGMILQMLPAISRKFSLDASQMDDLTTEQMAVLVNTAADLGVRWLGKKITAESVTALLTRLSVRGAQKAGLRIAPIIGQAISAGVSFGTMKLLGHAHIEECFEIAKKLLPPEEQALATAA
jgi:uncharacterized protein (DUF697 family)